MFDFYTGSKDKYIEGFLDGRNTESDLYAKIANILFLLREPNNPDQQDFWLKRILDDNYDNECHVYYRNTHNLEYFNTFATIAAYLLDQTSVSHDNVAAIKSCAYINLYARKGKGKASPEYKITLNYLSQLLRGSPLYDKDLFPEEAKRAKCVYTLLRDFITNGTETIVTVYDIYNMISNYCKKNTDCKKDSVWMKLGYKNEPERKPMHFNCKSVQLFGHDVKIYNFWHPSYRYYDFSLLKDELQNYYIELPEHIQPIHPGSTK